MVITLIGYRGCGKSSVGPLLADLLGFRCVDSDDHIEIKAGKSISQIFADDGEAEFRRLESEVLKEVLSESNCIVAAGGGAVLAEENRQRMKESGPVVWLKTSASILANRIAADHSSDTRRPSLTGKSIEEEVEEVLTQRLPHYQDAAAITLETEDLDPAEIAARIHSLVGQRSSGIVS